MPIIINAPIQHINQFYEELKALELKTAQRRSDAELDRLAELYGFARKNNLLLPITRQELPTRAAAVFRERFRINSSGKACTILSSKRIGFAIEESIGVGIINPRAIAKLTVSK